jgi:hypothetical protein
MDSLAALMTRPTPSRPAQPVKVRVRTQAQRRPLSSHEADKPTGAAAVAAAAAEAAGVRRPPPAPAPAPTGLAIETAVEPGFDIHAFLGSFIPPQPTPPPLASPAAAAAAAATPTPIPDTPKAKTKAKKKVRRVKVTVTDTRGTPAAAAAAAEAEPGPAATPPAKKAKKRPKVVVIDTRGIPGAAAAVPPKTSIPRTRPRSSQKTAKLAAAATLHKEIIQHGVSAPRNPPPKLIASEYYLNNRQGFVSAVAKLFDPIRRQLERAKKPPSCDGGVGTFGLLPQQEIVLNYINNYTPYRGLLLYHGLGSGKTCAAIAAAEGMMDRRPVYVMAPASLRKNFVEEIKFCGAPVYSRDQHWRFVPAEPRTAKAKTLAQVSGLPLKYISSKKGAWVIDTRHRPNWDSLNDLQRASLDAQLTQAITDKYTFIHYNGIRRDGFSKLKREAKSKRGVDNPFNGAVVVLEEAHNFVGMIVNKLRTKSSLTYEMYQLLMSAENAKIVFLTGTPFVNYPNEMAVMFNMLRGLMRVHTYTVATKGPFSQKEAEDAIRHISTSDVVEYSPTQRKLTVTRDPTGFVRATGRGVKVHLDMQGNVNSADFDRLVRRELEARDVTIVNSELKEFKALPDNLEEFSKLFFDTTTNQLVNRNLLSRRIIGLTSYFRSAAESLMPKYDPQTDFHVERIEMSDIQFKIYETARMQERKQDKKGAVKRRKNALLGVYADVASTYRIFSRSFCNFVFPPDIGRPLPHQKDDKKDWTSVDEDVLDNAEAAVRINNPDGRYSAEDEAALAKQFSREEQRDYARRIEAALGELEANSEEYLSPEGLRTWSPKFLAILERLKQAKGSQLLYSQFRTMEGLGIIRMVLLANGYTEFKLRKHEGTWVLREPLSTVKPAFVLYSGEEDEDEKEIIRNAFNGEWSKVPKSIVAEMQKKAANNNRGEVIQTIMITAAGAEGVTLHNVRDVHIVEPYWHPARIRQVIGRARRICSHEKLPKQDRTVEVWLYLMVFSKHQLDVEASTELRNHDKSKVDKVTILTTDQALYEMANIKEHITRQLEEVAQSTSIDCTVHSAKTGVPCFAFPEGRPDTLAFTADIAAEQNDAVAEANTRTEVWQAVEVEVDGVHYAMREETGELYDLLDYQRLQRGESVPAARMRISGVGTPGAPPGPRAPPRSSRSRRAGEGPGAPMPLVSLGVLEGGPGDWQIAPAIA